MCPMVSFVSCSNDMELRESRDCSIRTRYVASETRSHGDSIPAMTKNMIRATATQSGKISRSSKSVVFGNPINRSRGFFGYFTILFSQMTFTVCVLILFGSAGFEICSTGSPQISLFMAMKKAIGQPRDFINTRKAVGSWRHIGTDVAEPRFGVW